MNGLNLAYAKYTCLIVYGVMLHLDVYATCFSDTLLYNDEYYMQDVNV